MERFPVGIAAPGQSYYEIIRMVLTRDPCLLLVFASPQLTKIQNHLWAHLNHARVLFLPAHEECTLESHNEFGGSDLPVGYALYPKPRRRSWIIACSQRRVRMRWPIKTYVKRKVTILWQIQGTAQVSFQRP